MSKSDHTDEILHEKECSGQKLEAIEEAVNTVPTVNDENTITSKKFENANSEVRDTDVQDIINMMKDDLNQVKLRSKNDLTSLNDSESPKSSRTFNENDNYILTSNNSNSASSENGKEESTVASSNSEVYIFENEKMKSHYNEIEQGNEDLSLNETPENVNYFQIERTCCEEPECHGCTNDDLKNKTLVTEIDEYDREFLVDEDDKNYKDICEFIEKAKEFGANALDLSKKNLKRIPKNLFDLKNLQYIYLEGNSLTKLPKTFFQTFQELRWLDLRNNELTELPTLGLSNLENLRSLLLENNKIKKLPDEIANIRTLSALSTSANPLEYPSEDIVNKGFKHVQQFMRGEMLKKQLRVVNKNNKNLEDLIKDAEDEYYEIQSITDDVWASDGEETSARYSVVSKMTNQQKYKCSSPPDSPQENNQYIETASDDDILITKTIDLTDSENPNLYIKERFEKARQSANLQSTQNAQIEKQKLLNRRRNLPPVEIAVYKNEELEKALRNGNLEKYRKSKEQIDAKIQKINDFKVVEAFRNDLKVKQRQNACKRLTKGVDYIEPVNKAPFDISEEHKMVMTNEEREFVDKKIAESKGRSLSPDTLWKVEETRRARDRELEKKIIEYKSKLLNRRSNKGKSSNPKNDRLTAARDLKELKLIEKELTKRRSELQHNFRSFTGDVHYKELAKLDAKNSQNISAILKAAKLNSTK